MSVPILASAARTASGSQEVTSLPDLSLIRSGAFLLDVTAAATAAGDTLDVYLQSTIDGVTYDDFVHFTQVLGNGGAKKFIAYWSALIAPENELHAPQDAALAAGVLQGPVGTGKWRVKWVVAGATPSFTFSVIGQPYVVR